METDNFVDRDAQHYGGMSSEIEDSTEQSNSEHTQGNSVMLTAALLVADVVGAGILSMAVAVAYYGWLLGTIVALVTELLNIHVALLMWRIQTHFPEVRTYSDLGKASFSKAPDWQKRWMPFLGETSQLATIASLLALYTLTLGDALGMFFNYVYVCLPYWTILGCLITFPFAASARTLGSWPSLIFLNTVAIVGSICIPLAVLASMGVDETRISGSTFSAVETLTLSNFMAGLSTFLFAFCSQVMIAEITAEMEEPADFPKALLGSAPFITAAYLICGIGGYYYRGNLITGMIGDNMPFGSFGSWYSVMATCLVLHMLISWTIKATVVGHGVQKYIGWVEDGDSKKQVWNTKWVVLISIMLVVCWFISQLIPFFDDLVDLLGATLNPIACFLVPIIYYLRWMIDDDRKNDISIAEWSLIGLEVILAIFILFVGTATELVTIYDNWETYGWPFACHCDDIWSTCTCSSDHLGMDC